MITGRLSGKAPTPIAVLAWAPFSAVDNKHQLGEGVEHEGLLRIAGVGVDEAAHDEPCSDPVQVADGRYLGG
jgi:hypothetical protein